MTTDATSSRVPPHDEQAEKAVLGSILIEPHRCMYVCNRAMIDTDSFYAPRHRIIWTAICAIMAVKRTVDVTMLRTKLDSEDRIDAAGGFEYLCGLVDAVSSIVNVEHYADTLRDRQVRRQGIQQARAMERNLCADETPAGEIISAMQGEMMSLTAKSAIRIDRMRDLREAKVQQWRDAQGQGFVGIPSTMPALNRIMGGYRPKVVTIVGAYRGEGKSTFIRQEAAGMARGLVGGRQYKVALFSLEDPADIASAAIAGNMADVPTLSLDTGEAHPSVIDSIERSWKLLDDIPLFIVSSRLTMPQITSTAHLIAQRHGLDILFLDHLQFIDPYQLPRCNRNDTMAAYSGACVGIAQSLNIPVVAASQISRDAEKHDRKPKLSDLRDSGTIEQDARQVILMSYEPTKKMHEIEVAKNNFGKARESIWARRLENRRFVVDESLSREVKDEWTGDEDFTA